MRSAEQVRRTPREWHDHKAEERQRTLQALLRELRRAAESDAEWYRWIADGQPALTAAQYAEVGRHAAAGSPRSRRAAAA